MENIIIEQHDDDNALRYLSVCSGIEAASVAWKNLGWQAVAFSEIEPFPSSVLAHHYPDVPNLGDFTSINVATLGRVDILCGGTPCQAFSFAGNRQSLADARGNLTLAFVGLAHELADNNGLRNAVWENVPGVLSTKDNAFGCFLAGLVGADAAIPQPRKEAKWPDAGMVAGPRGRAAWRVQDAQFHGLAQRRRRVIVIGDFGNGADPASVLFERVGLRGNSPPRREAQENVAGTIAGGTRKGGGYSTDDISLAPAYAPEIARCDATREGSSQDYESTTMVAVCATGDVTHTLKAEGFDASGDGTGRGQPIIAFTAKDYGGVAAVDIAPTLRAGTHSESHANGGVTPAVTVSIRGREGGAMAEMGGSVAAALRASQGGGDKPHVLTSAVRRLTPRECERLQGFPDDYTRIPFRHYKTRKISKLRPVDMWEPDGRGGWWLMSADGPRYKALGNSWAVPKFTWIGRRLAARMPAANDNSPQTPSAQLKSQEHSCPI